jgi:hypothetical protein
MFERSGAIAGDLLEPLAICVIENDAGLDNAPRRACFTADLILLSASVH